MRPGEATRITGLPIQSAHKRSHDLIARKNMRQVRNMIYCILAGSLVVISTRGAGSRKSTSNDRRTTSSSSAVLRSIASEQTSLSALDQREGFSSDAAHREAIKKSLERARQVLPAFQGLVHADPYNHYAVDVTGVNLYLLRQSTNSTIAARVPLVLEANHKTHDDYIAVWAKPIRSRPCRIGGMACAWIGVGIT